MKDTIQNSTQEPKSNPLGEINAQFHRLYTDEKSKAVTSINDGEVLLICRLDNRLIVKKGKNTAEYAINNELYHNLKAMSHATLAVYYLLKHSVSKKTISQVENWLEQIQNQEPVELGCEIADVTKTLLSNTASESVLTHEAMSQYQQELESIYAKLMTEAVNDEIHSIVTTLEKVCKQAHYPSSKTFLIVFGGHQPRYKALALQVFKKWFAGNVEHISNYEHHVRYCEAGSSIEDAVELVATAMVDKELARSTMGYSEALNRDVLSAVADKAIESYWKDNNLR